MYVTYKNISSVYYALQKNRAVSCVSAFGDGYYVLVMNLSTKRVDCFPIQFQYQKTADTISMVYHNDVIDMSKADELCNVYIATISNYVLLLPELEEYRYHNIDTLSLYYTIDSKWKELDKYM